MSGEQDIIKCEMPITGQHRHLLQLRLRDQHTVERVAVVKRHRRAMQRMFRTYVEQLNVTLAKGLQQPLGHPQFAHRDLDRDFPKRRDADELWVVAEQKFAVSGATALPCRVTTTRSPVSARRKSSENRDFASATETVVDFVGRECLFMPRSSTRFYDQNLGHDCRNSKATPARAGRA